MTLSSLLIFCGSSKGDLPGIEADTRAFGHHLANEGVTLVYGGGRVGLMGVLADAVLERGGTVIGVIPQFLMDWEVGHEGITELIVVPDMHTRKRMMLDKSDAICALPGGVGTMDEFFEALSWRQLKIHSMPLVLANIHGYWDDAVNLIDRMVDRGYARDEHRNLVDVVHSFDEILPAVRADLIQPKTLEANKV